MKISPRIMKILFVLEGKYGTNTKYAAALSDGRIVTVLCDNTLQIWK